MGSPGRGALAPHPAGAARRGAGVAPARAPPLWHASPAAFRPGAFRATGPGPCSSTNPAPRREKKNTVPALTPPWAPRGSRQAPQQGWAGGRGVSTPGARFPGVVSCICQDAGANAGKAPPGPAPRGPSRFGANLQFPGCSPRHRQHGSVAPAGERCPRRGAARRVRGTAADRRCWQRAGGRVGGGGRTVGSGAFAGPCGVSRPGHAGLRRGWWGRAGRVFGLGLAGHPGGAAWGQPRHADRQPRVSCPAAVLGLPVPRARRCPRPPDRDRDGDGGAASEPCSAGGRRSGASPPTPAPFPSPSRLAAAPGAATREGARAAVGRRRAGGRRGTVGWWGGTSGQGGGRPRCAGVEPAVSGERGGGGRCGARRRAAQS